MKEEARIIKADNPLVVDSRGMAYDSTTGKFDYVVDENRQAKTLRNTLALQNTEVTLYTGRYIGRTIHIINSDAVNDIANVSIRDGTGAANDIFKDLTINKDSIVPLDGIFNFDTSVIINVDDANFANIWIVVGGYVVTSSS